jgi:hypothetical protein
MFVKNIRKAAVVSSIAILLATGMIAMLSFSFAEDENDGVSSFVQTLKTDVALNGRLLQPSL